MTLIRKGNSLLRWAIALSSSVICSGFVGPYHDLHHPFANPSLSCTLSAVKIDGYDSAFDVIDRCAFSGQPTEDLYDSVRVLDKNALKIYPDLGHKEELWKQAHGSWQLRLATGGGKFRTFKPVPIFAFAMIDEQNFGNGIGWSEESIWLSLLGPHFLNCKRRQMVITVEDMFLLGGQKVTGVLPEFARKSIGLGKRPKDFTDGRPPAFTLIAASEKSLIARGGSGGIAIWTRLENDIRISAYNHGV